MVAARGHKLLGREQLTRLSRTQIWPFIPIAISYVRLLPSACSTAHGGDASSERHRLLDPLKM
eukprot:scaffold1183_cov418-Prasinococcus_capsulatus_cf.AAC.11